MLLIVQLPISINILPHFSVYLMQTEEMLAWTLLTDRVANRLFSNSKHSCSRRTFNLVREKKKLKKLLETLVLKNLQLQEKFNLFPSLLCDQTFSILNKYC